MTKEIEAAVAALSSDPALAGSLGVNAAAVSWNERADRLLWASPGARDFASRVADENGRVKTAFPGLPRLAALAGGLAPHAGMRLERIRFSDDEAEPAAELSCRLVEAEGQTVLLTVFRGDPPTRIEPSLELGPAEEPYSAPFVERVRRQGRRRFIWSMDREGRFVSISPPLAEVVGPESADVIGLTWAEVVARSVIDPDGQIGQAIEHRTTWSDESVLWRIADTSYAVPVDLGGMPVFGRGHEFEGFRGFGLCRADEIQPAPDSPVLLARMAGATDTTTSSERLQEVETAEPPPDLPAAEDLAFEPIQARVGAQLGGARAVPLRAIVEQDAPSDRQPSQAEPTDEPANSKPILSVAERGALREIARALGARLESDEPQDTPPLRAPAEVVSISAARPREPDSLRILERLPVGILVLRGETPLFANRAVLELLGYGSLGELRRAPALFSGRMDFRQGSTALATKTGAALPVDLRLTSVDWADGPASLLVVRPFPPDRTDGLERSFELELARRDARVEEVLSTLDLAGVGSVTIDASGRILSLNRTAERMFGYRENEVAGEGFTTLIALESHRTVIDLVDAAKSGTGGSEHEIELFGRPRLGAPIPLAARAGKLETRLGPSLALVFRDVSGLRRTEADLTNARRAAEDAAARQTEFLARVSHEIRTPLNAILGFTEIMLEERFGPIGIERYKHYLRDIHESGAHVVSLVNDLLDLARVTAGRSELVFTSLDLNEIVGQSVGLMQPAAARERIIIRTSFAPALPRLVADERSIRQVVLNLVSNAVRYTEAGGQVIVSTSLTDAGELAFRVRDTGIGMTEGEVADALEPFRQVSAVRREDGTGLGLPLSKALVEANRGVFAISSRRGEGTLVEVVFPPARVLAEE